MSETNFPNPETAGRSALAKCERHGLHYDPAKMTGCVICRREERAAVGTGAATASTGGSALVPIAPMAPNAPMAPMAPMAPIIPWLVAAGLCLAAGLIFDQLGERMTERVFGKPENVLQTPTSTPRSRQMDKALRELAGGTP